jgi:hypothetical protein
MCDSWLTGKKTESNSIARQRSFQDRLLPRGHQFPRHLWFQVRNLDFIKRELAG